MRQFIENIFSDALTPERRLCIFTTPDKFSRFFSDVDQASAYVQSRLKTQNVYFGVGLIWGDPKGRGGVDDVCAVGGFWADIDIHGPSHPRDDLPANMGEARCILEKLPLTASLLVDSGYGLHAYWLFKEPWVFETAEEHRHASLLAKGWHNLVSRMAEEFGWHLENLGDLARVLRLPGTFNYNGNGVTPEVRVIDANDVRYNPDDFEPFIAEGLDEPTPTSDVVLSVDAGPPMDKMLELAAASPKFLQAWKRERTDLADQSQSGYDLALADIAALSGWSDQEIADLIIAARRKHGEKPEKALRDDYIARTIARARTAAQEWSTEGVDLSQFQVTKPQIVLPYPKTIGELVELYPTLREPVIHGLLREGETMNIISAPKAGKSWLANALAIAVATGRPWLETFNTVKGDVLIIDNELHPETSSGRLPKVAAARGIPFSEIADHVRAEHLRGHLQDLYSLRHYLEQFAPGQFKMIILDAFYRFLPMRADENDNGTMANLYNFLDAFADRLKCCFVLIHHTSKGNQSLKDVTDVGAGAGSQARATDTHAILRRHEEDDAFVLDAAVRSWPPVPPRCLRYAHPVFIPADDLDPEALKGRSNSSRDGSKRRAPRVEEFVGTFVGKAPQLKPAIIVAANEEGISDYRAKKLIDAAEGKGLIHRWHLGNNRYGYATEPQPEAHEEDEPVEPSKREAVETILRDEPDLSSQEVADRCEVSKRYVNRIRKGLSEGGN